jgi:hypothetical protein
MVAVDKIGRFPQRGCNEIQVIVGQIATADDQLHGTHMLLDGSAVEYGFHLVADHERTHNCSMITKCRGGVKRPAQFGRMVFDDA